MANRKFTDLPNLATPADADVVPFVDVSDTTESAQGTSVKVLWSNIKATLKTYFDTLYPSVSSLTGYLRSDIADTKTAGDLTFDDNVKIALGTGGAESEISSDGVDTNINLKSGDLKIQNNGVDVVAVERTTSKVGLGTTDLYGALTINTGITNATYDLSNQTVGTVVFSNGASGQPSPVITGKSSSNSALRIITASVDAVNSYPDFNISVRTLTAGDFSALTGTAFLLTRFNADLLRILRNGSATFSGNVTVPADPYTSDWNGDSSAAPKNDVYAEMETKITGSSGTYTPTAVTDVTFYDAFYQIIGNQCSLRVNFEFSTIPTSTPITFSLSLPSGVTVASPTLNRLIGAGHGYTEGNDILEYRIKEQAGSSLLTVEVSFLGVNGANSVAQFSITTTIEIN